MRYTEEQIKAIQFGYMAYPCNGCSTLSLCQSSGQKCQTFRMYEEQFNTAYMLGVIEQASTMAHVLQWHEALGEAQTALAHYKEKMMGFGFTSEQVDKMLHNAILNKAKVTL